MINISQKINLDWREKWMPDHLIGRDFTYSPDGKYVHIFISKNASGFIRGRFLEAGWQKKDKHVSKEHAIIVYRDPYDRWISGMAQYLYNLYKDSEPDLLKNESFVLHLFSSPIVDDHTEKQIYFLQDIDLNNSTFMLLGSNINPTLIKWFSENGYSAKILENDRGHDSRELPVKYGYKQELGQLMKDSLLRSKFDRAYADDIEFYKHLCGNNLFYK